MILWIMVGRNTVPMAMLFNNLNLVSVIWSALHCPSLTSSVFSVMFVMLQILVLEFDGGRRFAVIKKKKKNPEIFIVYINFIKINLSKGQISPITILFSIYGVLIDHLFFQLYNNINILCCARCYYHIMTYGLQRVK